CYIACCCTSQVFCHSCQVAVCAVCVFCACCFVYQQFHCFYFCCHVSQFELCVLHLTDFFAELFSFHYVFYAFVDGAFCQTQSLRSYTNTAAVQCLHCDLEALTFFAQQVFFRDSAVFKDQFACCATTDTHFSFFFTDGEAGCVFFYDKCGDTSCTFGFICHCDDYICISIASVCDEHFCAVQYIFVTIQNSCC